MSSGASRTSLLTLLALGAFAAKSILQLAVPVLAAAGGVLLLGERFTIRLVLAGVLLLDGIALAIAGRSRSVALEQLQ